MIGFFEKHNTFSLIITILLAVVIFFFSSLSFAPGPPKISFFSIFYHLFIFFYFSFFLMITMIKGKRRNFIFLCIFIALIYALSDELHQLFIPYRSCSFSDFLTDSAGILFASFLYLISIRKRRSIKA